MRILVAFASRCGSAREIAQAIAGTLRSAGHVVDVRPAAGVGDVTVYDAVVLGSAIYNQAWLPEATELVRRGRRALRDRPVWLFSVGSLSSARGWPLGALAQQEPKAIARLRAGIAPRDYHVFAGVIDPDRFSLVGRLIVKILYGRYGDLRNWAEIDAWARGIAHQLADSQTASRAAPPGALVGVQE